MVDFNNESTITRPAEDVLKILILERRVYWFDALEFYRKKEDEGIKVSVGLLSSRLLAFYLYVRSTYKRKHPQEYKELDRLVKSKKNEDLLKAGEIIDDFLDEMQLTKWDTKVRLGGNIVERNKAQGAPS
jgi:hypothetical protein